MIESFVQSADGTRLRTVRAGDGPAVVLVHGTVGSARDWSQVIPRMASEFTVVAFDRRGRGGSDDAGDYSIDREIEDVVAVISAVGPPAHLVGHSFGAVLSLLVAARAGDRVGRLVLYEPPVGDVSPAGNGWLAELEAAVATDELDRAVELFLGATGATPAEIQTTRASGGAWREMRDAVATVPREVRAAEAVLSMASGLAESISTPTLVLLGSEQRHETYSGVELLAERIPLGHLAFVPGRHVAMLLEPDAFVRVVRGFLLSEAK